MQHHARVFMRNTFNPCRLMLDVLYMMSHAHFKTEISQLCICVCRIWIWSTKRHNPSTIFSFPVYLSVILKEWDSQALLHLEAETWLLLLVNSGTDKTLQPVIKMKRVYAKKKKERKSLCLTYHVSYTQWGKAMRHWMTHSHHMYMDHNYIRFD